MSCYIHSAIKILKCLNIQYKHSGCKNGHIHTCQVLKKETMNY